MTAWRGIGQILGIRPREGARTALLFFTLLLVIAAYTTTKAVRDAVFLTRFSISALSWLTMAVAVVAAIGIAAHQRWAARRARDRLILVTNLVVAASLSAIALGLRYGAGRWLAWALYLWSSVFGLFLVAEFWLLANDLLNARQARRLYGLVGAGAILGGVVGGAVSAWGSRRLGAENLLHIVAVELVVAALLARAAWRRRVREAREEAPQQQLTLVEGVRAMHKHRLVRVLAGLTLFATVCATLVQWQWKGIARAHFDGHSDALAAFFGWFAAALNVVSLLLQLLLTTRLLRRWGAVAGLAVLPMGYLLGALGILGGTLLGGGPATLIAAAGAAMIADGLRFSVDKAAVELLYQPLERDTKDRVKPFVDTVVDRFGGGVAGLLWIVMVAAGHIDRPGRLAWASLLVLAIVGAWLVLLLRARSAYMDQLVAHVGRVPSEADQSRARAALTRALADPDPRIRRVAGEMAALGTRPLAEEGSEAVLLRLERHMLARRSLREATPAPAPVSLLTRAVAEAVGRDLVQLGRILRHRYPEEAAQAVRHLATSPPSRRAAALELLDHTLAPEDRGIVARLESLFLDDATGQRLSRRATLALLLDDGDPWLRALAVQSALGEPSLHEVLKRRTQDEHVWVREAAWRGLSGRPATEAQDLC